MPKIDPSSAPVIKGSRYPSPFDQPCRNRQALRLGDAAGLSQFGVNLVTLEPGAWSSQRHWHELEDEFAWVLEGEMVLIEDEGETVLGPGDCVGWKAGVRNGHHLVNRTEQPARFLVVGARVPGESGEYPDIDMAFYAAEHPLGPGFRRRDGTPY